jgi:nitrate reductase gamma subunit
MSLWKNYIPAKITVVVLLSLSTGADASWLIDHERFHVSVHGQLSCQDCHSDISERQRHPDPVDVNRSLSEFFKIEQCTECHEEVIEEIAEGSHAGQDALPRQRFDICIECHNPHYHSSELNDSLSAILGGPAEKKCSHCHDYQDKLPEFYDEDHQCLQCHQDVPGDDHRPLRQTADLCFHCHSTDKRQADSFPLIDVVQYESTPHQDIDCLVCHPQATAFKHGDQTSGDCGQCHRPHHEKVTHDLHSAVTCGACHLDGVTPERDISSGHIGWRRSDNPDRVSSIHRMQILQKDDFCRSCHKADNPIGAAAMLLPAKSIICMPCHASTISVGDSVTVLSLVLFLGGMVVIGSIWFAGDDPKAGSRVKLTRTIRAVLVAVFSRRLAAIVNSLILDGLMQRRLYRISKERWLLHGLIFYPFFFRFVWGIWALIASLYWPGWPGAWDMLDKNHPLTAFLFDFSGMLTIVGIIGLILRRVQRRFDAEISGLPAADWPSYALLGGIMIVGYLLEGMRMSMTGSPDGASYAFVGDAMSRLLDAYELTGLYGYVWYLHAFLTGAFIVYLPFSRMLHMIMAPVVLAMNAADGHR